MFEKLFKDYSLADYSIDAHIIKSGHSTNKITRIEFIIAPDGPEIIFHIKGLFGTTSHPVRHDEIQQWRIQSAAPACHTHLRKWSHSESKFIICGLTGRTTEFCGGIPDNDVFDRPDLIELHRQGWGYYKEWDFRNFSTPIKYVFLRDDHEITMARLANKRVMPDHCTCGAFRH